MMTRPRLYNESDAAYARRVQAAEDAARRADDLRAYMRQKSAATIDRLKANIRIVPDDAPPAAPTCPTCEGLGLIRFDVPASDERWGKLYPCPEKACVTRAEAAARRADALLTRSGVPGTYRELTFDSWFQIPEQQRAGKELAAAAAWVWAHKLTVSLRGAADLFEHPDAPRLPDNHKTWLVFQGDLGLGKTGLAAAATNQLAGAGRQPLFYRLQEMFSEIQSRYGDNETGRNADDIISQIQRAEVLILDECNVPGQRASEDKARLMEEVVRYRHARQLPTLLTLNASQTEFEKQWGRRTADVVFASAHWLELTGPRLRRSDGSVRAY